MWNRFTKALFILLICSSANATEVIVNYSDKTLPVLNDMLQDFDRNIIDLNNMTINDYALDYDLTEGVQYFSGSTMTTIPTTDSGSVLMSDGADTIPVWGTISGGFTDMELFTSTDTWTKPSNTSKVYVKAWGGGGGGGGASVTGGTGGTTSFGSVIEAVGGDGGINGNSGGGGGTGGSAGSCTGTLTISGLPGSPKSGTSAGGAGAGSTFNIGVGVGGASATNGSGYSSGGGGSFQAGNHYAGGGGSGAYAEGVVSVTGNVTVTIGAGGAGRDFGGDGAPGLVIVYWNE